MLDTRGSVRFLRRNIAPHVTERLRMTVRRVNIDGASEITGSPVASLRSWRVTDQGPRSYVIGGRLWYDVADLETWMADQMAGTVRGGVKAGV
jgi:hypothetical protein